MSAALNSGRSSNSKCLVLLAHTQVVFDRFDKHGTGSLSAADARDALEYMGRNVGGEACASWLADKERKRGDISFVDFITA